MSAARTTVGQMFDREMAHVDIGTGSGMKFRHLPGEPTADVIELLELEHLSCTRRMPRMNLHLDVKILSRQKTKARLAKFTALVLGFSLAAFIAPISSSAAEKTQFRSKGSLAVVLFDAVEGCIGTDVFVRAFDGTEREGSGKPTIGAAVNVFVERFNFCDETLLLSAEGSTAVSGAEFQIDKKLEAARLTTTVEVTDSVSGNSFNVSVDLSWTATSQPEVVRNRFFIRSPGRTVHEMDRGAFREASTSGTVSSEPTNFLQNLTEVFADMQSVNEGFREVIKF